MYRICKAFTFEAAHRLEPLAIGKCAKMHGHSYRAEVTLRGEMLDNNDMLLDFTAMGRLGEYISQRMDHNLLNDIIHQPTAENIARHLFDICKGYGWPVESVRVWETRDCWGEYRR